MWIDFDPPIEGEWGTVFGAIIFDAAAPEDEDPTTEEILEYYKFASGVIGRRHGF